jgi:Domain of unknown function (DUF4391)
MNTAAVIAALALPPEARVDKRVPKKLLIEQGAPTAGDKRQIKDGIEELTWIAALKPSNIGVPAYRDDVREYLEIAVLTTELRATAKAGRLTELIHRAIPYPVVLMAAHDNTIRLSLAHKRLALNDNSVTVLNGAVIISPPLGEPPMAEYDDPMLRFLESLPLASQPRVHLCAVYQGWIDRVEALQAACVTGRFSLADSSQAAADRRAALAEYDRIQKEIVGLRGQALKETQMNRRVDANLSIRRLEGALAEWKKKI